MVLLFKEVPESQKLDALVSWDGDTGIKYYDIKIIFGLARVVILRKLDN